MGKHTKEIQNDLAVILLITHVILQRVLQIYAKHLLLCIIKSVSSNPGIKRIFDFSIPKGNHSKVKTTTITH